MAPASRAIVVPQNGHDGDDALRAGKRHVARVDTWSLCVGRGGLGARRDWFWSMQQQSNSAAVAAVDEIEGTAVGFARPTNHDRPQPTATDLASGRPPRPAPSLEG